MDSKNIKEEEAAKLLAEKESSSGIEFDKNAPATAEPITSLGKSEQYKAEQNLRNNPELVAGELGWKAIPVENLPSAGTFYPEETKLEVKAASVAEIRHFSSIDETDPLDMDDKLNLIMDKCLKIKFSERQGSYKDLKEEDRFYLLFVIRDLTFKNGENKLFLNIKCGAKCLGDGSFQEKVELKNENFDYYNIESKLMRFYNKEERAFIIDSPKVGPLKIYVPSLGVTSFIKNYLRDKIRNGEFYDKTFMKVAPFMFEDWRTLNEGKYKKAEQDSFGWNSLKLSSILKIVEMIRFGVKTEVKRSCDKCGAEVAAPLTFPGGVKSLFLISDPLRELFED